jgi:peptidyl-prolyl cis-trans isomerase C
MPASEIQWVIIYSMQETHRRRIPAFLLLLAVLLILVGCNSSNSRLSTPTVTIDVPTPIQEPTITSEPMAVQVNGDGITKIEFQQELQRFQDGLSKAGKPLPVEAEQKLVLQNEFINQLLLQQGAVKSGFQLSEADYQARVDQLIQQVGGPDAWNNWLKANFYTESTFQSAFKRSFFAAWMRDQITSKVPTAIEQVHVQQIRVLSEAEAQGILAQLQTGTPFADLAALYDPATKGELGWFPRGYLAQPAVEEAAFSLEKGAFSGVVKTEVGFHIILLVDKDPQHTLTPDAYQVVQEHTVVEWLADQKTTAQITIQP